MLVRWGVFDFFRSAGPRLPALGVGRNGFSVSGYAADDPAPAAAPDTRPSTQARPAASRTPSRTPRTAARPTGAARGTDRVDARSPQRHAPPATPGSPPRDSGDTTNCGRRAPAGSAGIRRVAVVRRSAYTSLRPQPRLLRKPECFSPCASAGSPRCAVKKRQSARRRVKKPAPRHRTGSAPRPVVIHDTSRSAPRSAGVGRIGVCTATRL
jgi:hypothetical protein